ncbi:MAG TPA: retropepsin-like aspartic protease [Rhizomicrobium sp.]|nr:retropepsin-like aspartic protease [Rhizomicrobium sp.]
MLRGRFGNTSSAPYLECRVNFPRLGARGLVSFLVDTGADATIFMPTDCRKMGVDFRTLRDPTVSRGIGGEAREFQELATLSFSDQTYVYTYVLKKSAIAEPTQGNPDIPSLLGRDILHKWRFVMERRANRVEFTPLAWDLQQKI